MLCTASPASWPSTRAIPTSGCIPRRCRGGAFRPTKAATWNTLAPPELRPARSGDWGPSHAGRSLRSLLLVKVPVAG
jgi:hypothetical protein